ncbi:prenylated rab acceptor PRA1 [Lipomyces tetrasporus]|uniref:PRA1 family protein n=1 Tax=Lipomyces tetrasporus TaxID=54092 RepID=A0AAD7VSG1_9ASCO|nr:prenylated rab acceptor PRA1 [Lipomyces tetrasporus]KAJ8099669.1 prenylated rab acceptor PRA1 [Lipomyces tetrasporus]
MLRSRMGNIRPVSEFFDFKRVSKPKNMNEVQKRVTYNLSYFSANYLIVFAMLSVYSLLTNMLLLFVLVFVSASLYGINYLQGADLNLGFVRLTTSQLYVGLLVIALPLGFLASPFSTILWLLGAACVTIIGHAAIMDKPIESAFSESAV